MTATPMRPAAPVSNTRRFFDIATCYAHLGEPADRGVPLANAKMTHIHRALVPHSSSILAVLQYY